MPVPVLVKNKTAGPAVFTDPVTKVEYEWGGTDDPAGNDYQYVPDDLITNVNFVRSIDRGVFEVVDASPEVQAILERQQTTWKQRDQARQDAIMSKVEKVEDNDLISLGCVGPGSRGTGECGTAVPIRSKSRDEVPPLCNMHKGLASEFVLQEGEFDNNTGKAKRTWFRPTQSSTQLPSQQ